LQQNDKYLTILVFGNKINKARFSTIMAKGKIIVIIALVALTGISLWLLFNQQEQEEEIKTGEATGSVLYIINKGEDDIKEYKLEIFQRSTVFSLLEKLAEKENFTIETSYYPGIGVFIESINGLKGGTDNKWWQYWVNASLGENAADKKEIKTGDVIEWKFENPLEF